MPYESDDNFHVTAAMKTEMIRLYECGMSGSEIAKALGFRHSNSVRQILKRLGKLRTQGESGKLAYSKGKKQKWIDKSIEMSRTINRYHPGKAHHGENHPKWIKDRSLIKQRAKGDEKIFFKEIISERGFVCQLTGQKGRLSVHHIKGVWSNPELRYSKDNCIVVLTHIHLKFHKMYGQRTTKEDWDNYVVNKEYIDEYLFRVKKNYVPFEDRTGKRYGRLLAIRKVGKEWECLCDCGNTKIVATGNLKSTKSCGCLKKEMDVINAKRNKMWLKSPRSNKNLSTNKKHVNAI